MSELSSAALSSAISGASGLLGSGLNYYFNKKLAEQQNQYNIDMWKMQAEYNSPQAQMQRFQEAGLNPNLIYGQGSNGNMSQAPQMVTPDAPEISKDLHEIGKLFNIENLRTIVANRKKAQAEARIAQLTQFDKEDERQAETDFGTLYVYDPKSGRYVYRIPDENEVSVTAPNPRGSRVGDRPTNLYHYYRFLASHDPRAAYLSAQRDYLAPQIWMSNYDRKFYKSAYWIGQGGKIVKSASDIVGMFNPARNFLPIGDKTRGYLTPGGRFLPIN